MEDQVGDNIKKQNPKDFQRLWEVAKKTLMREKLKKK